MHGGKGNWRPVRRPRKEGTVNGPSPVAVVTGAARGVGRAVAGRLAGDGYRLVLGDVDGHGLHRAAAELGGEPVLVEGDIARAEAAEQLAGAAEAHFGRLDVWVNNAGIVPLGRLDDQEAGLLAYACQVNLTGTVQGCRAAALRMHPQGGGHIVNIASVLAVKPLPGFAAYSATKAGVLALSRSLHRELRVDGIHVTAVLPYMVHTAAAAGIRPRVLPALRPQQVADAVAGVLQRPRPQVFVPRAARLLSLTALLPQWADGMIDALLGTDAIARDADAALRGPYETELRDWGST
ncbi:SDR family NAD(P)-dependent oxidoreductase [Streptomyces longisporus]|uniref:SDR family oxidoreductase n=1 Tax=Streptomyces longisporus TaxID=1948 RepID=A0ABP5XWH9_STRLO